MPPSVERCVACCLTLPTRRAAGAPTVLVQRAREDCEWRRPRAMPPEAAWKQLVRESALRANPERGETRAPVCSGRTRNERAFYFRRGTLMQFPRINLALLALASAAALVAGCGGGGDGGPKAN